MPANAKATTISTVFVVSTFCSISGQGFRLALCCPPSPMDYDVNPPGRTGA